MSVFSRVLNFPIEITLLLLNNKTDKGCAVLIFKVQIIQYKNENAGVSINCRGRIIPTSETFREPLLSLIKYKMGGRNGFWDLGRSVGKKAWNTLIVALVMPGTASFILKFYIVFTTPRRGYMEYTLRSPLCVTDS